MSGESLTHRQTNQLIAASRRYSRSAATERIEHNVTFLWKSSSTQPHLTVITKRFVLLHQKTDPT